MPRAPRFQTAAIRELFEQLRYAPSETRRREMDAAEQLAAEIDPSLNYPRDFIVFRVTGYRLDETGEPLMLVGEAVLPDLVRLVQRLSRDVDLPPDYRGRVALSLDEVRRRLSISPKTLQRYRKRGLICHHVMGSDRARRLICFEDALERFSSTNRNRLASAATFSRVDQDVERQIIDQANRLRAEDGVSLNQAARQLSHRHGRAQETVRSILRRHDRSADDPIFNETGPLRPRDWRVAERAWRFGVPMTTLTGHFGKTAPTIHRAINRVRHQRLVDLHLQWIELPTFALPEAEAVILASPAINQGLTDRLDRDLLELLDDAHGAGPIDEDVEDALIGGYNLIKKEAASAVNRSRNPGAMELDFIETRLRWAAMLKRHLVALAFPAAIRAVELNVGRRLAAEPHDQLLQWVGVALAVAAGEIESIDPRRGQRLERVTGFAMDRALAIQGGADSHPGRAAARHQTGSLRLSARLRWFCPWQRWLELRPDLISHLELLEEADRAALSDRHGWSGRPPLSLARLAEGLHTSPAGAARLVRRAEDRLRAAARGLP